MNYVAVFCAGWAFGSAIMWFYFYKAGLIRTREEYYAAHPEERPDP